MVPIPVADQKDRGLWERDCLKFVTDPRFWGRSLRTKPGGKYCLYGKPGNSGENSNGMVYPGRNFQEKK